MKKYLLLLGLLGCGVGTAREPSEEVKKMGSETVALVWDGGESGEVKVYCTGVWVGEREILTADHCVQSVADKKNGEEGGEVMGLKIHYCEQGEVEGIGEDPSGIHMGKVVGWNENHDLALVRAVGKMVPEHKVVEIGDKRPGVGERVRLMGHVRGLYWSYIEGVVAGYRSGFPGFSKMGPFMQLSAPVYFGNSGGGVFDKDGKLVGIVSFMMDAPLTNFAIDLSEIKAFLKESRK